MTRAQTTQTPSERLATYRCRRFTPAQHDAAADRVRELVLAAEPVDAHAARVMASNLSGYLADVMPPVGGDPDEWISDLHLGRWMATRLAEGASPGTLGAVATAVRRSIRLKAGGPARVWGDPPAPRSAPGASFDALCTAVAGDAGATAALVAAFGAGVVGKLATSARVVADDDGTALVTADGVRHRLLNATDELARSVVGIEVTAAGLDRLLAAAVDAGVPVTNQGLRDAWTIGVLSSVPFYEAVGHGIGKKRMDWAEPHLQRPGADEVRDLLRGVS